MMSPTSPSEIRGMLFPPNLQAVILDFWVVDGTFQVTSDVRRVDSSFFGSSTDALQLVRFWPAHPTLHHGPRSHVRWS